MKATIKLDLSKYDHVEKFRKMLGVTLTHLEKQIGVSTPTLSEWTRNPGRARFEKFKEIQECLLNKFKKNKKKFDMIKIDY